MRCRFLITAWLLALIWFNVQAKAEPLFNARSEAVTVLPGPEVPLQNVFSQLFDGGSLNVAGEQSNVATFRPTATTAFTYVDGYAGYRATNVFGIYETTGRAERFVLDGSDANGNTVAGSFSPSAQLRDFFWFLDVNATGDRMWSNDVFNDGNQAQMVAFTGTGQAFDDPSLGVDGFFDIDDILIAFEDLNRSVPGRSDDDFNDMVVLIENVDIGDDAPPPDFEVSLPENSSRAIWLLVAGGLIFTWRLRSARQLLHR